MKKCAWIMLAIVAWSPCVASYGQVMNGLSPSMPHDVFAPIAGATGFQSPMDDLSWQTFIALNWPASSTENGVPNRNFVIGGQPVGGYYPQGMPSSPTVWETYKDSREIFLPGNPPPKPKPFSTPTSHNLYDTTESFTNSPLIDQNGNKIYYEVRLNEVEFNFIVQNQLYDSTKQPATISFPAGNNTTKDVGSVHVKAAWKIMGGKDSPHPDDPSRFYTSNATIYEGGKVVTPTPTLVGLVGLHIAHKTSTRPQWVWSTFEQVDNCPDLPASGQPITPPTKPPGQYSFCNAQCNVATCPPNQQPAAGSNTPVQVLRVTPIDSNATPLNTQYQQMLRNWNSKNVWQYYQLVSTQWPAEPSDTKSFGKPQPQFLANTVLETYFQGPTPPKTTPPHSCIACHGENAIKKDFMFQLYHAFPKQKTSIPGFSDPPAPETP